MSLSKTDLNNFKKLIEITLDERLDKSLEKHLDEKLKHLPSKDEFYNQMDEIMAELKIIRDNQEVKSPRPKRSELLSIIRLKPRTESLKETSTHPRHKMARLSGTVVNTHRITSNEKQITHIKDKLSLSSSS